MRIVETFDNLEQAELLRGRLEAEDIQAFVADAAVVSLNWMYSNVVGGVKVQVHENDYDAAMRLIHGWRTETSEEAALSPYQCPHCGSTKVEFRQLSKSFFMLSLLLLSIPLAFYHPRCHCLACGKKWKRDAIIPAKKD